MRIRNALGIFTVLLIDFDTIWIIVSFANTLS